MSNAEYRVGRSRQTKTKTTTNRGTTWSEKADGHLEVGECGAGAHGADEVDVAWREWHICVMPV